LTSGWPELPLALPIVEVSKIWPAGTVSGDIPNLAPISSIVDYEGKLIGRFGDTMARSGCPSDYRKPAGTDERLAAFGRFRPPLAV
jgi:hypothetical protein